MSYPPGNQGQYGAYTPRPARAHHGSAPLHQYLAMAVVALGLATYLVSYGATIGDPGIGWSIRFAVLAALAAGFGLLPRQALNARVIATLAGAGFLDALSNLITTPGDHQGWSAIAIVVLTGLQALAAAGGVLVGTDMAGAQANRSSYQAYADYYAQAAQYYGQYGQQQPQPDTLTQGGSAHAQQTYRVAAPQQDSGSSSASYADYVGHYEQTAAPSRSAPSSQQSGPPGPQAGLPNFGQAQGPAEQYGGSTGSEQRPSSQ